MKVFGVLFMVLGGFFALAGFLSYSTDIQLGIGISGLCMFGIGLILVGLSGIQENFKQMCIADKNLEKDEN